MSLETGGFLVRKENKQMADQTEVLDTWRQEAFAEWTDERIVSKDWLDICVWFHLHTYADLVNFGLELDGYSFRKEPDGWLLVLKVTQGDTPYVVFLSSRDTIGCMRKARSYLRNGGFKLYPDRFR